MFHHFLKLITVKLAVTDQQHNTNWMLSGNTKWLIGAQRFCICFTSQQKREDTMATKMLWPSYLYCVLWTTWWASLHHSLVGGGSYNNLRSSSSWLCMFDIKDVFQTIKVQLFCVKYGRSTRKVLLYHLRSPYIARMCQEVSRACGNCWTTGWGAQLPSSKTAENSGPGS